MISIIITTYRRNTHLRKAIESVLEQSVDIEIFVVDGAEEDHAREVANEYPVNYIHDPNPTPQGCRETGFQESEGDLIKFLDDDDQIDQGALPKQADLINTETGVVYSGIKYESGDIDLPRDEERGEVLANALGLQLHTAQTSTLLIKREVLEEIAPLGHRHGADDMGLKIELARRTKFDFVPEPLILAGEPEESRGVSEASISGRAEIINRYSNLYEQHPDWVQDSALYDLHLRAGRRELDQSVWSASAILHFGKAVVYCPDADLSDYGEFLSSLFGSPGRHVASYFNR